MGLVDYYNQCVEKAKLLLIPLKYNNSKDLSYEKIFNNILFEMENKPQARCFVTPCLQKQRIEDVRQGRRLSLEFLTIMTFDSEEIDELQYTVKAWTGIECSVGRYLFDNEETHSQDEEQIHIIKHVIEEARGFPYNGVALDLFNANEIWLGRVFRFVDQRNTVRVFLSLGIEQLLINAENVTNIWSLRSFYQKAINGREVYFMDQTRKNAFLYDEDMLGLSSTWLPKDLFC